MSSPVDADAGFGPPAGHTLRTLAGLAGYTCGHTGSCCRAGWPIPIEPAPLHLLTSADSSGRLPEPASRPWAADEILGHSQEGDCVFFGAATARAASCRLEAQLGFEALPYSCRQFPRILLADGRGWHVSLSAWCGTVAALLARPARAHQVTASFLSYAHIEANPRVHVEGLDAREAWPPLLRPGILAGLHAYDRWERRILEEGLSPIADGASPAGASLGAALRWTDLLRSWRPADGALHVLIGRPWRRDYVVPPQLPLPAALDTASSVLNDLIAQVPHPWRPVDWPAGLTDADVGGACVSRGYATCALGRYLATRLVSSWLAYQGEGLRSVLASLTSSYVLTALALTRNGSGPITFGRMTSALRAADWLQLHLLDRADWARWCSGFEAHADSGALVTLVGAADVLLDALTWAPSSLDGTDSATN
jgi:hypothetical protein